MKWTEQYVVPLGEVPVPMWVVEMRSIEVVDVNDAALRYFHCSRKEFLRMNLQEIFSPHLKANLKEFLRGKKWQHKAAETIWLYRGSDGKWFSGEISLKPILGERQLHMVVWQEQNFQRLQGVLDVSPDGIIKAAKDGSIVIWNRGAERIFGFTREEALGRSVGILLPYSEKESDRVWRKVLGGQRIELEQIRNRIALAMTLLPLTDMEGKVHGAAILVQDLTERRRLELDVLKASEWEQQRIAQDLHDGLGQHLAGVHCRMTVFRRALELKNAPEAAEAARITELMNQAVAQARALARGLYPIRPDPAGFISALRSLAGWVEDVFKIRCDFRCQGSVLISDNAVATHLYRITQEAITNAYRHGHARHVKIALASVRKRNRLTVEDDGVGIPAQEKLQEGLGLRLMRYRAEVIHANLTMQRSSMGGVKITCLFDAPSAE